MPKLAGTFTAVDAKGNRERISDAVSMITPEDTPIYSMLAKKKTDALFSEWVVDDLAAPADNAQPEGNEFVFAATAPVEKQGNFSQIFFKGFIMSESQKAVKNAGKHEQPVRQKVKKGVEIRKDIEFSLLANTGSVGGETRRSGGLPTWYKTNVSRGAGGANGGFNTGTKQTVAATNGTQRAFTKALLDNTLQQIYQSGGKTKYAVVSPYVKSVFTTFMSDSNVAPFRVMAKKDGNALISTVDMYIGDYDKVSIVPNRVQATAGFARNIHLLDPDFLEILKLREIEAVKEIAKTGDAEKFGMVGEQTLCVKNEKAIGVIADVFGMTAST